MNLHFIAIGGSVMHNLAIALKKSGHKVSGSDDIIYEPARSQLEAHGLLPKEEGWFADRVHTGLDCVILGMHARKDNPELQRAEELKLPVYSFPEFVYQRSKEMLRVVVAGSHGKTTITSMVMHVMRQSGTDFNYLVGARLEGFDTMVQLDDDAPTIIIEGDEYLTSPLDLRPKFLHYKPQLTLLSGIAWDHVNAFPTFENYVDQFRQLMQTLEPGSKLVYFADDPHVQALLAEQEWPFQAIPYRQPDYTISEGRTEVRFEGQTYQLDIFGQHNLCNAEGARLICAELGFDGHTFWRAMESFTGAARRLQVVAEGPTSVLIRDFAHAPSKVEASVKAVRERYPDKKIVAVLELHTYSSLNKDFLPHYRGTVDPADEVLVFLNPEAMAVKRMHLDFDSVKQAFDSKDLDICSDAEAMMHWIETRYGPNTVFLLMSSGNLADIGLAEIGKFVANY
jgi:UDP-N-acetylmuramate: L-alanyl-gamma-D-glutamyl-meso-diaminopimelate ligase